MDNIMDPELASEMVKLLAQELKVVRAQLREAERRTSTTPCTGDRITHERAQALVSENDSLKADNVVLQEKIAMLQGELKQGSSMKSEEDLSNPLQYTEPTSHMKEEFARLLAENEELIREKEEASRNREKLSILQGKYRQTKAKVLEYDEILNELRVALSDCTQELEQSRKTVAPEIDFRDFLENLPYRPVEGQSELSLIQSYPRALHTELGKSVMVICKGPYFVNYNEVIWSPSGIALGLVIKPTFQYNPKIHAWTKFEDAFDVGNQMDVCCLSGNTCRYLGTYERVGDHSTMMIAPEALRYLDRKKLDCISSRTTLLPDLLPPSQTQMINNMYKQGVIKIQCFGIRCVAFNQTFAEKLRERDTSSVQRNLSHKTVVNPTAAITSGDNRKRKQHRKSTVHSGKNKKRYGLPSLT